MEFYAIEEEEMEELKNKNRLHISVRRLVENFCKDIIAIYGSQLKSITLYGSALTSFFNPKKSDVNIILVLDNVDLIQLKKYLPLVKRYGKRINPLLLTKGYIQSSQDVYPIEFLEMKENYLTVYGEDILQNVHIDNKYLRLECEQQLKGSLLKLRQGFLRVRLENLIKDSISSIFVIFRNLIRIKGEEPPIEREKIIERMVYHYNIDRSAFNFVLKDKRGMGVYFGKYLKGLEMLTEIVDRL